VLPFELPAPKGSHHRPVWTGSGFTLGAETVPILEYSENFAGWSDDLTAMHEEAAGDSHPIDQASRRGTIQQLRRFTRSPESSILEIGCSSGFLLRDLRTEFPLATLVGADVVREPLFRLAKALPSIPLIRFDLLQNPLPKSSFDAIVMLNVLEHIEDDERALRNVHELLKPGGVLVLEVPAGPCLFDSYDAELRHFRRYAASALAELLNEVGFEIVRRSHLGFVVFPGFAAVKLKSRLAERILTRTPRATVRRSASSTSNSRVLRWAFAIEGNLLSGLELPFGIRALFTARKPM
jgi:SAM-dependent methyltransferase